MLPFRVSRSMSVRVEYLWVILHVQECIGRGLFRIKLGSESIAKRLACYEQDQSTHGIVIGSVASCFGKHAEKAITQDCSHGFTTMSHLAGMPRSRLRVYLPSP